MTTINPLTPVEFRLRQDLGTNGDAGVELHAKVDRIKTDTQNILTDTADMQPKLGTFASGTAAGDIAAIKAVVDAADIDNNAILAELADGTYGLSAIKTAVDTVDTVVDGIVTSIGTPVASVSADIAAIKSVADSTHVDTQAIITTLGTPDNGTVSADIADIASKVDQIQNNTRTTVALLTEMELPSSGSEYFLIQLNNFDNVGNMEAPDAAPTVSVQNFAGTDRSGNLVDDSNDPETTMILDSVGRYHLRYEVASTHAVNEGLLFSFTIVEGGVTRIIDRVARVVEEVSSTFTGTDRANLGEILADTSDMQPKLGTPAGASISADIAALKTVADNIEVDTTAIEADTQDIQSSLTDIEGSGFVSADDSLEALSNKLDTISSAASTNKLFVCKKTSGSIADGANELVVLGTSEGVESPYGIIKELRVVPTTQTSTNFTVEIFENAAATISLMRFEKANSTKDDLRLAMDLVFVNQNGTPTDNIYIKITNENDSSSSVFNVEVRGVVGNL